ncbi:MAG: hypothetical protein WC460_00810 [Patescibacteria group bacterium]
MLDEQDINKLANVFATKQDLGVLATKKDLEICATKGDLMLLEEKMKEMIDPLATKSEVS